MRPGLLRRQLSTWHAGCPQCSPQAESAAGLQSTPASDGEPQLSMQGSGLDSSMRPSQAGAPRKIAVYCARAARGHKGCTGSHGAWARRCRGLTSRAAVAVRRAWSRSASSAAAFSSTAAQRPRMPGEGAWPDQLTQPKMLSASLPVREVTSPAAQEQEPDFIQIQQGEP